MSLRVRVPGIYGTGLINLIRYGLITPSQFYYGNTMVSRMYLGSTQIYG